MEKVRRFLRILALVCLMLLASIGMGLTGAAPVYSKDRDALSEVKVEHELEEDNEELLDVSEYS